MARVKFFLMRVLGIRSKRSFVDFLRSKYGYRYCNSEVEWFRDWDDFLRLTGGSSPELDHFTGKRAVDRRFHQAKCAAYANELEKT